jgi:hypothetical protein
MDGLTLTLLLILAAVIPLLVIAGLLGWVRLTVWSGLRPVAWGWIVIAIGVAQVAIGLWEWRETGLRLPIVVGVAWIVLGIVIIRRREVVDLRDPGPNQ